MLTHTEHKGEESRRFFRLLHAEDAPGYLTIWTRQDRLTRWVPANDLDLAAQTARLLAQTKDVYFGVGLQPRDLGQSRRGQAKDVIAIPGLWADVDVRGPAHKGTDLPPTKDDARTLLGEFPLEPTLVVDSGHGLQPWWLFKEPWVFDGDEQRQRAQDLVRRFQATLQAKARDRGWSIDTTSDLARVMRPAGTWNHKLDLMPVRIIELDEGRRYNPGDFGPYLSNDVEVLGRPAEPVDGKIPEGRRNSTLASIAGTMRHRGLGEEAIFAALWIFNQERCTPPLDEAEVRKVAKSIARYQAGDDTLRVTARSGGQLDQRPVTAGEVGILLSDVEPEQVDWLWLGRMPKGKLTVLDGDPGLGKSAATVDLAARVSAGLNLPDDTPCEAAGAVICSAEDGLADTIRPRLDAAGGDPSKVLALATVPIQDTEGERLLSIPEDLPIIRRGIERVDARLVIVDPLMAFLSGNVNSHRDQDVRRALAPLTALAEDTGAAVVVVRHLNKTAGGNALYRGGGSIGIIGAARCALLVAKHPEDENLQVLASVKSNLGPPASSLAFALNEAANGAVRVEWKGATSFTAATLLAAPVDPEERSTLDEAKEFLRDALEDGPRWSKAVTKEAREADIREITLKRAKRELGVRSEKEADGSWSWRLPESKGIKAGQAPKDDPLDPLESLPNKGMLLESQEGQGDQEDQGDQVRSDERLAPEGNGHRPGERCIHDVPNGCWLCQRNTSEGSVQTLETTIQGKPGREEQK